jgi:mono/diheme cytochrome c family protein
MKTRTFLVVVGVAIVVTAGAGFTVLSSNGFSTRNPPTAAERVVSRTIRRWSVPKTMRNAANPVAFSPEVWVEARAHFADHCAACHANNGSGDVEIGRNLYPRAPDMRLPDTQALTDGEIYWIIENGVRLTGMPAWGDGSANDIDTWKLVHFIRRLNQVTQEDLTAMKALNPKTPSELEEEHQDQQFLGGQDDAPAPAPSHHH